MWSEHVTLEYPYHFEEVLKRLSFDPLNVIQLDEKVIYVPLCIDEEQIVVRLQGIGTVQNPQFWISSQTGDPEKVMKRMRAIFIGMNRFKIYKIIFKHIIMSTI